jgi:hypothetical protein
MLIKTMLNEEDPCSVPIAAKRLPKARYIANTAEPDLQKPLRFPEEEKRHIGKTAKREVF